MTQNMIADHVGNACLYTTYAVCLIVGVTVAVIYWNRPFTNGNGTRTWLPLTLNFIASGLGCGILVTYPQIAAFAGIHGLFVYSLCGAVPLILFAVLGPMIKKHTPQGFVVTEWIRERYGVASSLMFSAATILTIFLFTVSELTSIQMVVESLTHLNGLPALIVEAVVAGAYTSLGGFHTSFFTDNLAVPAVLVLLVVVMITMGVDIDINKSLVGPSGLLKANLLGWKLIFILFIAIMTNDCFMAGFWLRTFAAKTNRDLYIACFLAATCFFVICSAVGIMGMIAVWAELIDPSSDTFEDDSALSFFYVVLQLPKWVSAFTLVFAALLSTCTIDTFQSAMASTVSNDFFRNRVRMIWIRAFVLATLAPSIVVATTSPSVLNIYLVADILSAAIVPVLFMGLSKSFWFLTGWEIIMSLMGGVWGVFIFGTIFWGNVSGGGSQLVLNKGIYGDDWSAFGTFATAPVASVIGAAIGLFLRGVYLAITTRRLWAVFDKDVPPPTTFWGKLWRGYRGDFARSDVPWFKRYNFPTWFERVDYYLFVQDEEKAPLSTASGSEVSSASSPAKGVLSQLDNSENV